MQPQQNANSQDTSFFQCYICFQTVRKPRMCPSCSKLACHNCLRTWIQQRRPQCPHCRKTLPLSSFADCERFVNDVKHLITTMDKNQRLRQKCLEHNIEMHYYCCDCQDPICSDCGMFGSKHRGHNITHLNKIYQQNKTKILNQLARFDTKIQHYRKNGYMVKLEMQKLIMQMGQKKAFIEQYFVTAIQRLQQQFKQKQQKISEKYDNNSRQVEFLETFRDNICQQLEGQSEKELIMKSDQFIRCIHSLCDRNSEYQEQEYTFDTIHEIVPKYNAFVYVLKDYHALPEAITYSDPFCINGIEWRLKIYPKGNGVAKDTHVSVFLQMTKAYVNQNKYEYKIELINHINGKQTITREYSSKFDIGQCWGYNQFIAIVELDNGFLNEQGGLQFRVSVRNPSYRSLVRDQKRYIQFLQSKVLPIEASPNNENRNEIMNDLKQQVFGRKKDIHNFLLHKQQSQIKHIQQEEDKGSLSLIELMHRDEPQEANDISQDNQ